MIRSLSPVPFIIALVLLDLMPFRLPTIGFKAKEAGKGIVEAFAMGVAFALAMCPTSAALHFGGLIPLSVRHNAPFVLPFTFASQPPRLSLPHQSCSFCRRTVSPASSRTSNEQNE